MEQANRPSRLAVFVMISGMLISGSINTLSKKLANQETAISIDGNPRKFAHPWFQTWVMFLGEAACLLALWWQQASIRKAAAMSGSPFAPTYPLQDSAMLKRRLQVANVDVPPGNTWIFAVPALLDLLGTTFAGIGLLYTDASVFQLLRGSIVIFSGVLSRIFLKQKKYGYQWFGMLVVFVGLFVVGYASVIGHEGGDSPDPDIDADKVLLGDVLIILGQLMNAIQMVVEESFLKNKGYPPLYVVGMEGSFGAVITAVVVLPLLQFVIPGDDVGGSRENTLDAFYMMSQNAVILSMTLLYLVSIAFYNNWGLRVTKSFSVVHRTLIDALRSAFVWGVGLGLYYTTDGRFGEPWSAASPIQAAGFAILFLGTLIYNNVLKVPCFDYTPREVVKPQYVSLLDDDDLDSDEILK